MKKILASLLVIGLLASGCSFFKKSPQSAVNDGIKALAEVKKYSSSLTLTGTIHAEPGKPPVTISATATGKSDSTDSDNPKTDTTLKITATADTTTVGAELLVKVLEKKLYVNLMKLDVSGEAGAALQTQLKDVFNNWWFFPVTEGQNQTDDLAAKQEKIMNLFKRTQFFVNAKEEGSETVGGVDATRYSVELDKGAVKDFLVEVIEIVEPESKPTAEEKAQMEKDLETVEFSGAVWVGDDGVIHRIKGTLTFQPTDPTQPSAVLDIDYTGSDYGKDVVITVPENPKEFNPVALIPLLGAFGALDATGGTSDLVPTPDGVVAPTPTPAQ